MRDVAFFYVIMKFKDAQDIELYRARLFLFEINAFPVWFRQMNIDGKRDERNRLV